MKTLVAVLAVVNILSFIAGHFWVNDTNSGYCSLIALPMALGVLAFLLTVAVIKAEIDD